MHIEKLEVEEVYRRLYTAPTGLDMAQVEKRRRAHGPNEVEQAEEEPLWRVFLGEFTHFFALVLWMAVGLSLFAAWRQPGEGMGTLAVAIALVVVINGLFSFWQRFKAERTLAALKKLLPTKISVVRQGQESIIDAWELVPGDVIFLEEGQRIPADCRLVESLDLRVNNATVTGESLSLLRTDTPSEKTGLLEAENIALAGTVVVSGRARAVVFATGSETQLGAIASETGQIRETNSPLNLEIARISRLVTTLAISLGVILFFASQALGMELWQSVVIAIGLIVGLVPEGLLPTVTLSLALGSQRMARRKAVVRHLAAIEALGAASVICTDKTGTLTKNQMVVHTVALGTERHVVESQPAKLMELGPRWPHFFETALFCEDSREVQVGDTHEILGDPMEVALIEMARQVLRDHPDQPKVDEIPFDSSRKRLTTVHQKDSGLVLYCKGALETVLPLCTRELLGGEASLLDQARRLAIEEMEKSLASEGLRVLALAFRPLAEGVPREELEEELIYLGMVGLEDPPREEVEEAIAQCHRAGIRVIMLTGDHPVTASAIASRIGLSPWQPPRVIGGDELRGMNDAQLKLAITQENVHFARLNPGQKVRIVSVLQDQGHIVAVTGDGVNDAPALKKAEIGVAMGKGGTDAAREACDLVLLDDNFATIVAAIAEGRAVFSNIRKFLTYIFSSNVAEVLPFLAFVLLNIPLPLPVLLVLAVDLGTDILPALALGAEKADPAVMDEPPHRPGEHLLDRTVLVRALGVLGTMEGLAGLAAYFLVLYVGGWSYGEQLASADPLYLQATTACFAAITVLQVVNLLHCRNPIDSSLKYGLRGNRLLLASLAFEVTLVLAIIYWPPLQGLFSTAAFESWVWIALLPMALIFWGLEEGRKLLARRKFLAAAPSS